MTKQSAGGSLIKLKINRLKNKLIKEQEKQKALFKELKKIEKLERLLAEHNDKTNIEKVKRRIANI